KNQQTQENQIVLHQLKAEAPTPYPSYEDAVKEFGDPVDPNAQDADAQKAKDAAEAQKAKDAEVQQPKDAAEAQNAKDAKVQQTKDAAEAQKAKGAEPQQPKDAAEAQNAKDAEAQKAAAAQRAEAFRQALPKGTPNLFDLNTWGIQNSTCSEPE